MGLDIGNAGGDFKPWVKYNAKAGRWYIKGENGDVEVANPEFVADFENIQTGWFYFSAGNAPERVMDVSLSQKAPKPDRTYVDKAGNTKDCFKRGFALDVFSNHHFGGVVELSSTSAALSVPISYLYDQYEAAPESKQGLLPVVKFVQANPVTGKHGTNYEPVFQLVKWVNRPDELQTDLSPAVETSVQPAPQPAPAPVAASGGSEF